MTPNGYLNGFSKELTTSENAEVHTVGSRSLERAKTFAATFEIPNAYGSYTELVADANLDIVCVATPHPHHRENALIKTLDAMRKPWGLTFPADTDGL